MDPTVFDPLAFALLAVGAVLVFAVGFVSSRVGRGGAASAQFEAATLRAEALAEDSRYQYQEAMRKGHVYNHVKTQQPNGANDYWEGAMARPDLLLHDLVKILHPHLLPDHTLIWYKNLDD